MQYTYHNKPLILASQSPRRRYLLEQAELVFSVIPSSFDENSVVMTRPDTYVKTLAESKASEIAGMHTGSWVIGADTIVMIDNHVLGKPDSPDEARRMLQNLSGRTHQVYTGYSIQCVEENHFFSDAVRTDVCFKKLTDLEIEWYVHTKEPFDKAGAYAIQGLGTFLVRQINGSYTNVVGLPVCEVLEHLLQEGVIKMKQVS
ncbi:MAG: septum formation inhibitor Maf [Desulfobacteraceae bacterium]|nr:MAG: septum formation inhibitor Maf [Desulfobacteraceae bacterium]